MLFGINIKIPTASIAHVCTEFFSYTTEVYLTGIRWELTGVGGGVAVFNLLIAALRNIL